MSAGGSNEPNLTPFIDLFSVLICFLLMSAAWIQLESLPVQVDKKKDPTASAAPSEPPPVEDKTKKVKLALRLFTDKLVVTENEKDTPIPNSGESFDKGQLSETLKAWRGRYPDKKDIVLNTDVGVTYGSMIHMYDFLISENWPDVGINPY